MRVNPRSGVARLAVHKLRFARIVHAPRNACESEISVSKSVSARFPEEPTHRHAPVARGVHAARNIAARVEAAPSPRADVSAMTHDDSTYLAQNQPDPEHRPTKRSHGRPENAGECVGPFFERSQVDEAGPVKFGRRTDAR